MIINQQLQNSINQLLDLYTEQQQQLEMARNRLIYNKHYDVHQLFRFIDKHNKEYTDLNDLSHFISQQGQKTISYNQIGLVFNIINIKNDQKLDFQEFFIFLLPQENKESRKNMIQKQLNDRRQCSTMEEYIQNQILFELLIEFIEYQVKIENIKNVVNEFHDFQVDELFMCIDNYGSNKIGIKELLKYYKRQRIMKSEFEIKQLLNRIDNNQDNYIEFEELRSAFTSLDTFQYEEVKVEMQKNEIKTKTLKKTGFKVEQKPIIQKQSKQDINKIMMIEIVETLQEFIRVDAQLENIKNKLANQSDFNLFDLFRCFDKRQRQMLVGTDLIRTYNEVKLFPDKFDVYLIIRKYDREQDNQLDFKDFIQMFSPFDPIKTEILLRKSPKSDWNQREINDMFSDKTIALITELMVQTIENVMICEALRQRLNLKYKIEFRNVFDQIANCQSNIRKNELIMFMGNYRVQLSQLHIDLLYLRFDKNHDSKVIFTDFMQELDCQSPKKYI